MQAGLRQKRLPAHEAKHHGPPAVQPRPFCRLPENDVGRDALAELTEIAEEGKLDVLHVFQLWDKAREQAGAQTSHPYETVGRTTASKRRLIMGKDLSHIRALCLADKRAAAPLPVCNSLTKASVMPPDS